jgi:hypothetical protein
MKQRELITQLFNLMTGLLCEKIEKITLINGYEKIRHKTIMAQQPRNRPQGFALGKFRVSWRISVRIAIGGLMVGIEMRGEADDDILDSVVDPAPLAVEIDDS